MGIISAPAQDLYWSKDKLFHLSCVEERFTRTRFEIIQRYFHLADTTQNPPKNQPGHDKLVHVRTITETIRENFKRQYNAHKEVSIDEAMIGFSGRIGFKQREIYIYTHFGTYIINQKRGQVCSPEWRCNIRGDMYGGGR